MTTPTVIPGVVLHPGTPLLIQPGHIPQIAFTARDGTHSQIDFPALIQAADPLIGVAGNKASIHGQINNVLSPSEVAIVNHLIDLHNMPTNANIRQSVAVRPVAVRLPLAPLPPLHGSGGSGSTGSTGSTGSSGSSGSSGTSSTHQALGGGSAGPCTPHVSVSINWWGFQLHLDHCTCDLLKPAGIAVTGATGSVLAILAAAGLSAGPWGGLAAGLLALMLGWVAWADGHCPMGGANYNQTWTVQGWITTNC